MLNNLKKYFLGAIALLMMLQTTGNAYSDGAVNILTRYGYLRAPEISALVKSKCGVNISCDEYYHDRECFSRLFSPGVVYEYDIAIFASELYSSVKKKMEAKKSHLSKWAENYSSSVKEHYLFSRYPDNVAYFTLSFSGFIWNPKIINISASDSIDSMFKKAKNNIAILINNSDEIWALFEGDQRLSGKSVAEKLKKIIRNSDIYITNGYNGLYNADNFSFAFQRSGDAVDVIKKSKNKKLAFLVQPKYSYISPDLIGELNALPQTQCVAQVLTSKEVLDIVQRTTYYLSPYGTYKSVNDPIFQGVYRPLFNGEYKIRWKVFRYDSKWSQELRNMWNRIHMLPQILKNHSVVLKQK